MQDIKKGITLRKPEKSELSKVYEIYERVHTLEESGLSTVGWVRGVYPTPETLLAAHTAGTLYALWDGARPVAAAKIDDVQVPEYELCTWRHIAPPDKVLVLHMLAVHPDTRGRGLGSLFVKYYEDMARTLDKPYLRMDTNEINVAARRLYKQIGYIESGIVPCCFNGIENVRLVCLEKRV